MDDIGKSECFQCSRNDLYPGTVDRSINDLHVVMTFDRFRRKGNSCQSVDVQVVDFRTNDFDQLFISFEFDIAGVADLIYFSNRVTVVRSDHLCTVVPIGFVAVIFFRVMGCCQDDTALTSQFTDSERHFRCWAKVFKHVNFDTISREDVSRYFGKLTAVVTAVMSDNNFDLIQVGKFFFQII